MARRWRQSGEASLYIIGQFILRWRFPQSWNTVQYPSVMEADAYCHPANATMPIPPHLPAQNLLSALLWLGPQHAPSVVPPVSLWHSSISLQILTSPPTTPAVQHLSSFGACVTEVYLIATLSDDRSEITHKCLGLQACPGFGIVSFLRGCCSAVFFGFSKRILWIIH